MLHVFGDIWGRLEKAGRKETNIDNFISKLHYRFTFWLLLACTTLVCSRQYFGQHIQCIMDSGVPPHVVQSFCFFTSTYTVSSQFNLSSAHPGIAPHVHGEKKIYHPYYQWVPFVLFGQALLFYLPHLMWKNYEAGTMSLMCHGLQKLYLQGNERDIHLHNYHILSTRTMYKTSEIISKQFQNISRYRIFKRWAFMMCLHEMLNLLNACFQLHLLDVFLGGNFVSLGYRILAADPHDNPFDQIFPKVTKCYFSKYGPSGSIQGHDVLCVMALNIINEKIYTLLWFWLAMLVPVSGAALIWRAASFYLYSRSEHFNKIVMKEMTGIKFSKWEVGAFMRAYTYSDWLLLIYLGSNMDSKIFYNVIQNLNSHKSSYVAQLNGHPQFWQRDVQVEEVDNSSEETAARSITQQQVQEQESEI